MANITYWHDMPTNATDIASFMSWANETTSYTLGPLIAISAFIITFISLKLFGFSKAFASSSFAMFLMSTLLWAAGMLSPAWPVIILIMTVVGALLLKSDAEKYGI